MSLTTDCDIDRVEQVIADAVSVHIAPISFDLPDILADGLASSMDCDGACSTWVAQLGRSQWSTHFCLEGGNQFASGGIGGDEMLPGGALFEWEDGVNLRRHICDVKAVAASPEDVTPNSHALGSSFMFGEQQDPSAAEPALTSDPKRRVKEKMWSLRKGQKLSLSRPVSEPCQ
ncbi:uncharacterized protein C8R40DRAFT_1167682 [Lentinula edodes]|uniref:uncharacterized protein n=1 Tax=Lentinula edodes TaxID=5353 RepID=UPI001E8DAE3D|nr:uncharacterized protein C8R40DRAFT_1167682 [Lentinula edodes]KAH7878265.1 hypothetical protein C8R40DRAFT_1167682 [Lentinula edodes]